MNRRDGPGGGDFQPRTVLGKVGYMADEQEILNRWRLVLGKYSQGQIAFSSGELKYMDMENVLDYLYSREYGEEQELRKERGGGSEGSRLTVPSWLHQIKKLFPRQTVEVLERHALEKYGMTELLTDPEVLRKLEPNKELLKTILELKGMMKGEVLDLAREIVRKVAEEIARKLEMFRSYEDQIKAAKAAYNNEQMMHMMDESQEIGEKIAEAVEKSKPKTPEERMEDLVEEVTGTESGGILDELDEVMEEALELQEEMQDVLTEEMTPDELQKVAEELPEAVDGLEALQTEAGINAEELQEASMLYRPFDIKV